VPPPVLFVSYAGAAGGAERILLDVASGLGGPVALLCPQGPLADRATATGMTVLARPARPLELRGGVGTGLAAARHLGAHAREIRSAVATLRPRAVVAWGMRSALAAAGACIDVPVVVEHVDLAPRGPAGAAVRRAARRARRVVALSHAIAGDLDPEGRLGDRLVVAWPGVDVDRFSAAEPPAGPPTALLLGALVPWKRPGLALEAVALAARELPGLRLVVAGHAMGGGSAELVAELRARAARPDLAGRVTFVGALANPRPALCEATCLLHCADAEPFGLVLLEAMASARPVVAPFAAGPAEILAGGGGVTYAPGDPAAAARALVAVLGDPAEARRLGAEGRARAVERFGLEAARERWRAAVAGVVPDAPGTIPGERP
jgi:glycosyltransferase involved in cell wall biosynthesis